MLKTLLKIFFSLTIVLIVIISYLSIFGIKTNKFNDLIKKQIIKYDDRLNLDFDEVFIKLNTKERSFSVNSRDVKFFINKESQKIENIDILISLNSLIKKDRQVKKIIINSKENEIKDLLKFIRAYKINIPALYLENSLKKGNIIYDIIFNFENNKLDQTNISGRIINTQLNILGKEKVENIDLNFNYNNKKLEIVDLKLKYKNIDFSSNYISANLGTELIQIEGSFENKLDIILLQFLLGNNFKDYFNKNILMSSKSNFEMSFNRKFKINKYKVESKIKFNDLEIQLKDVNLNNYISNYDDRIILKDGYVKFKTDNSKKIELKLESNYILNTNNKPRNLSLSFSKHNLREKYELFIDLIENEIIIDEIDFINKKNNDLFLKIILSKKKNSYQLDKFKLFNNDNIFILKNIKFEKNFKIKDFTKIEAKYYNKKKYFNDILISKNKNIININSKNYDSSLFIEKILKSKNNRKILDIFRNLNASIEINIKNVKLDKDFNLNNLIGKAKIVKNKIVKSDLSGKFDKNNKFVYTKNSLGGKIVTTIFSDIAEPFVKKFNFIKGFEGGKLDYTSTNLNKNLSKSELRIYNFKLKDMPALTKLLSMASLQGIADLATGEGIRFNEFDMFFDNSKNLITINEIYALGPAISILMEGYIEKNELVSLRGTLVPATTINKTISKIPLLGNILVGEKAGEGIFGVSFKIKGPPKDLDTRVNPIKTLTPRFITRTLDKLKKTN